jgi:hypothetical protein
VLLSLIFFYVNDFMHGCVQEKFVEVKKAAQIYFRDGRKYTGTHTRFLMEHAGSRGKVSALQMWDFIQSCSNNDLGVLNTYDKTEKDEKGRVPMSRRMLALTKRMAKKWRHILCASVGIKFCKNPERIGRFLKNLVTLRQLDTVAYLDSVAKKKIRRPAPATKQAQSLKDLNRKNKRKICNLLKSQNAKRDMIKHLRSEVCYHFCPSTQKNMSAMFACR